MKGSFDIGTSKDDNPSATAHGKAIGAVHTYALKEEKIGQKRAERSSNSRHRLDGKLFRQDTGFLFSDREQFTMEGRMLGDRIDSSCMDLHESFNMQTDFNHLIMPTSRITVLTPP